MNFLELCQEVAEESGTVAGVSSFTTVANPTGRVKNVVRWVRNAFRDIQNERSDWMWMRKPFTKSMIINQTTYTDTAWALDVAVWLPDTDSHQAFAIYDPALGVADEGAISQLTWQTWRTRYERGLHTANRPTEWAVTPQNDIAFGVKPDKAYTVRGEYRMNPQMLTLDTDTPEMPVAYHGLIVGEALRLMARSDEALTVLGEKAQQYERLRQPLVRDQTPPVYDLWGGAAIGR